MLCPYCQTERSRVIDTTKDKRWGVRRRRECLACAQRFSTIERPILATPLLIKEDGTREEFDREKLKSGIMLATVKRNVSSEAIDNIINEVVEKCHELGKQDISTSEIGEMVMNKLRQLDEVAYIRFASVYREFQDLGAFKREIDKM